jgi:hypothetical protein
MVSVSKFLGILTFQAMLIVAKRIINFLLDFITQKEKRFNKQYPSYRLQNV